ncbi:hypothetical protein EP7_004443 [Isosphaeraceae bacterium EP7]
MRTRSYPRATMAVGVLILGGLAGLATAAYQGAAPRFVYASGAQGVRYYANPGARAVTQAPPAQRRTVGPGTRDWTSGRRLGMHKPWLQSRG